MLAAFRAIAEVDLPLIVHPFNQSLFDRLSVEAFEQGKPPNWRTFSEVYTDEAVWHTAVAAVLELQRRSGVRLQLAHTHSARSLELIRRAKDAGQSVTCEVDPKYYLLTMDDLERLHGLASPAGYVHADANRMAAIYRALNDGTIDNIGTDHAPHTREEIAAQEHDAWHAAAGSPQLDWIYSLLMTDMHRGRYPLRRLVEMTAEAPARLVGAWPRKGLLAPGSDADLLVVDMDRTEVITDDSLQTKCGWTPTSARRSLAWSMSPWCGELQSRGTARLSPKAGSAGTSERAMTSVPDTEGHALLVGRVAIVTGGARGIGKAISKRYASEGARVVIADIDGALGEETAAEIRTSGGQSHAVQTDVSKAGSVTAMTESALIQFGRIDILVNNAAVLAKLPRQPFADIPEEQWDLVMLVNVKGPWLCIRSVSPTMRDQGYGKVINMSSDMILSGIPGMLHYVASKGALMAMTRSLARELGPDGICVNAVAPGFTITDAAMAHGQEANERNIRTRAIQRAQSPEDLTGTLVYLASAASDFVTGQLVTVNGGSVLH